VFDNFSLFLSTLLKGVPLTAGATGGGIVLTIVLSFVAGLAMLSRSRLVRFVARVYVEGWRGTSEVVQLFWIYFAVPLLVGFQLVPLWAGILVLGLNHGAYGGEIVRGAVRAVPRAQDEGAIALNMPPVQRLRRVILPQAFVEMVPPFNNLFIQLLKSSSLLSLITVTEITYQGQSVLVPNYSGQSLTIFLMMLVLYLILSVVITVVMRLVERWAAKVAGRPPTARVRVTGSKAGMELGI
jgi:polar amino acid transport system permease protein